MKVTINALSESEIGMLLFFGVFLLLIFGVIIAIIVKTVKEKTTKFACRHCGAILPGYSKYCHICGSEQKKEEE